MNDEFGLSLEREIDDLRSGALLGHVTHGANPPVGPMCLGNRRVVSSAIIGLTFAGLYLALTSNSEFTDLTASQLVDVVDGDAGRPQSSRRPCAQTARRPKGPLPPTGNRHWTGGARGHGLLREG
jgi:hypothetical protein